VRLSVLLFCALAASSCAPKPQLVPEDFTHILQLKVTVSYSPRGTSQDDLAARLVALYEQAQQDGTFVAGTKARLEWYAVEVNAVEWQ
jgi:hypothetical protein